MLHASSSGAPAAGLGLRPCLPAISPAFVVRTGTMVRRHVKTCEVAIQNTPPCTGPSAGAPAADFAQCLHPSVDRQAYAAGTVISLQQHFWATKTALWISSHTTDRSRACVSTTQFSILCTECTHIVPQLLASLKCPRENYQPPLGIYPLPWILAL